MKKLLLVLSILFIIAGCTPAQRQALPTATATPDYMIIGRSDLMSLPTSGTPWATIKASADASATPDLCNQDNKADVNALAAGIVYARTGDTAYQTKAISLIKAAQASQRDGCGNAILAMGRQLGGYVMAADFVGYRDPAFVAWLDGIIEKNVGGHSRWYTLRGTAYNSANNWGVFALASLTASDIYLNQTAEIGKDWAAFAGYGVPHGYPFQKTADWQDAWSCIATDASGNLPIAINTPCTKSGINLDGAPVEDSSRSAFGTYSTYIHESTPGYVVMAQLFSRAGFDGWTVNNKQVCRAAQFAQRAGRLNDHSVAYHVAFMANKFCGLSLPTVSPTNGGRLFGFTDWLYGGSVVVTPISTTAIPPTIVKTITPIVKTATPIPQTVTKTPVIPTVTLAPVVTVCAPVSLEGHDYNLCTR